MNNWYTYLKRGLSRKLPEDRISGQKGYSGIKSNLKNLYPIISRHWRKGLLGFLLIIISSLFSFPQPLIFRYIVDDVILDRQIELLLGAILLLILISVVSKVTGLLEEFYVAHFEQEMTLHIQQELLERTIRFPKLFFDDNQTGYLMSRLSSDVEDLRWLFSGTIVHIISNVLRFSGGIVLLFYLEWRLTFVALVILPGLGFCIRYFSVKIHILSHQSMEQQANVSSHLQ